MSDIDTTADTGATSASGGRIDQAKTVIGQAGQAFKEEAQSFASAAQDRARSEAQRRTETATKTLGDFANAVRRAGDELGQSDQSPAARLVRQAADGLESLSRNLAGKQPEDLLDDVRSFARRNPAAFIGGAVLVGVALGRFVRASESSSQGSLKLEGEFGGSPYPLSDDTAAFAGDEGAGAEALGVAEEDGFDGAPELSGALASPAPTPLSDDLGDLTPSDVEDSTSVTGADGSAPERREP